MVRRKNRVDETRRDVERLSAHQRTMAALERVTAQLASQGASRATSH